MQADITAAAQALGDAGYDLQHADWYDAWGTAIGYAFALNDLLLERGGETNPTFRPELAGADTEAYEYQALVEANLSVDQLETAERIIDGLLDKLIAAGRDYY
jgi:hypothetical protein